VGLDVAVAVPEVQEQGLLALLDRVYQTGETYYTDTPFAAASAAGQPGPPQTAYYNFTFQAYHEAGQVAGISTFAYDVTEQVLAQQQREAQQQQQQAVFEQAPVAITVLRGPDLIVDSANAAICALWGRSPAAVLGRPYFEAVPDAAGQGFEEILAGVLQTGEPYLVHETPVVLDRAHTGLSPVGIFNFVFQPLFNPADPAAPIGIVAVGTEVTEQVRARQQVLDANQALSAANQQLTRTNADLDTFIYTASHDLKAPITNIEGLLTALGRHLPEAARQAPPMPQLLQLMQGAVERFQHTIAQLTDLTRLQQAQQQPAESVDLAALIEAVRLDLAPLLAAAGAQMAVDVADCPTVRFAPQHLRSIIYNLLSNAVKYRHPDRPPVVQLRCRPAADGTVVLEVEDNGLGLSEGQQARLFGLFQRLHTHVEGTGVGLYMLKRIVDNADGTIAVRSQLGRGTTFTITLPD
jgi:signal transduction histidine kinase